MRIARLRLIVFFSWIAGWLAAIIVLLIAAHARGPIGPEQVRPGIQTVSTVWLPVLGCFAAFWFSPNTSSTRALIASKERTVGAITLTWVYLFLVLTTVLHAVYGIDYNGIPYDAVGDKLSVPDFQDHLEQAATLCLWISPLATAPVVWLTGEKPSTGKG